MRPLHILVDLDDVVAELMLGFDVYLDARGAAADGILRYHERAMWSFGEGLSPEAQDVLAETWSEPGLWANLEPVAGAKETLERLRLDGHTVEFVSTPHPLNRESPTEKYEWVVRTFGSWAREATTLTYDKTGILGDVLIDDRPTIEGKRTPSWERIIFDRPWNLRVEGYHIQGWDYEQVVAALEAVTA